MGANARAIFHVAEPVVALNSLHPSCVEAERY